MPLARSHWLFKHEAEILDHVDLIHQDQGAPRRAALKCRTYVSNPGRGVAMARHQPLNWPNVCGN